MALKTFKKYTAKLNEGFLDDDNEEALTADKFTSVKEGDEENPFPAENDNDELSLDAPNDENDVDLSDEIGSVEAEDDKTEEEDLADLKLDELSDDDDIKDSGDEKAEEKKAEQETAERTADTMDQLKDAIATLTTKIEALTDKVNNSGENAEGTEGGEIQEIEQDIVERVFHIGDRKVNSLITHRKSVVFLPLLAGKEEVRDLMLKELHSIYLVYNGNHDDIVGVVNLKNIFAHVEIILHPNQGFACQDFVNAGLPIFKTLAGL